MEYPLPVMERWICRACRPGGCFWASGSSSLGERGPKTMPPMSRCIEFIKPKWPRRRLTHRQANNGAPPTGLISTITNDRMRPWGCECQPSSITKVGVAIQPTYVPSSTLAAGLPVRLPKAATFAGVDESVLLAEPLAITAWVSNRSPQTRTKFISALTSSVCWLMPIRAACGRHNGLKPRHVLSRRNLCRVSSPSPMSCPRACNLLYRRFAIGRRPTARKISGIPQIANLRYGLMAMRTKVPTWASQDNSRRARYIRSMASSICSLFVKPITTASISLQAIAYLMDFSRSVGSLKSPLPMIFIPITP